MPDSQQCRRVVGTSESVQGDSFDKVIFLSLQRRWPEEVVPAGHGTHEGRRLVGLTLAKHELLVSAESLQRSADPKTSNFQRCYAEEINLNTSEATSHILRALHLEEAGVPVRFVEPALGRPIHATS